MRMLLGLCMGRGSFVTRIASGKQGCSLNQWCLCSTEPCAFLSVSCLSFPGLAGSWWCSLVLSSFACVCCNWDDFIEQPRKDDLMPQFQILDLSYPFACLVQTSLLVKWRLGSSGMAHQLLPSSFNAESQLLFSKCPSYVCCKQDPPRDARSQVEL